MATITTDEVLDSRDIIERKDELIRDYVPMYNRHLTTLKPEADELDESDATDSEEFDGLVRVRGHGPFGGIPVEERQVVVAGILRVRGERPDVRKQRGRPLVPGGIAGFQSGGGAHRAVDPADGE